jgi:outer membrane murein-binding lipoprotein Lpp
LWKPFCGFQAAVDGALSVHGCDSVHTVVELREDVRDLHHYKETLDQAVDRATVNPSASKPFVSRAAARVVSCRSK